MSRLYKFIGFPVIALALALWSDVPQAEAGGFSIRVGNYGYGHHSYRARGFGRHHGSYRPSYSFGHRHHGVRSYPIYGTHPAYHPRRTHYDYHPRSVIRHGNHYDYVPGHFDLHHGNHYHH